MQILLVDNGTTLLAELKRLVPGHEIVKRWTEVTMQDLRAADAVVLSGSSVGPLNQRLGEFEVLMEFLRQTQKPVIGVCFGCELINVAFGGTLRKLEHKHSGVRTVSINSDLLDKQEVRVYEQHLWAIDKVARGFDVEAMSVDGPEAIKHRLLPIYGLQFHPEHFVDKTEGDEIFLRLFKNLVHEEM